MEREFRAAPRDAAPLKDVELFIGHLPLDRINSDFFVGYRKALRKPSFVRAIRRSRLLDGPYNWRRPYGAYRYQLDRTCLAVEYLHAVDTCRSVVNRVHRLRSSRRFTYSFRANIRIFSSVAFGKVRSHSHC
jgi:hypothetical protein